MWTMRSHTRRYTYEDNRERIINLRANGSNIGAQTLEIGVSRPLCLSAHSTLTHIHVYIVVIDKIKKNPLCNLYNNCTIPLNKNTIIIIINLLHNGRLTRLATTKWIIQFDKKYWTKIISIALFSQEFKTVRVRKSPTRESLKIFLPSRSYAFINNHDVSRHAGRCSRLN